MLKFMFLCPHQIMWKMNQLSVKMDLTKKLLIVVILEVRLEVLPASYLLLLCLIHKTFRCFSLDLNIFFKKRLTCLSVKYIDSKIKNVCLAKFRKSYKITSQLKKYVSQFTTCETRICSLNLKHFKWL